MKEKNWISIVFQYGKVCKGKMILSVCCAIVSVVGGIVPYYAVFQILKGFVQETVTANLIETYLTVGIAGHVIKVLFHSISTMLSHVSAYTILEQLRLAIADRLMHAPLGNVVSETVGKIKNIIVDRVETIELPLAHLIPEGLSNCFLSLGIFIYLLYIDWRMGLASMFTLPIAMLVFAGGMKEYNRRYETYMNSSNNVNSVMVEYVEGIEVIKAFNQSSSSYQKFKNAVINFREYTLDWFRSTWKSMNLGSAILPSALMGVVPIGLYLYLNGTLSPEKYIMCIILAMGVVEPLTFFTVVVNDAKSIQYAVHEANKYLTMEALPEGNSNALPKHTNIEIKNVSFRYEKDTDLVLKDLNLSIKEGEFAAIVGPSGGGKSTIAKLIARFWDVSEGSIAIGSTNIKELKLNQLADLVSFVTQDNFLFDCSLKENIRLGNPSATDEEVYKAAKAACCDSFINKLDNGYETDAGTAGARLSGGEKQRIALARAMLKNAPIVILDEATAFTDPENEDKIQKSIAALTKGKTKIVIAHRLSTIKNADHIIIIKDGTVLAEGIQEDLLEQCELYQEMWNAHIGAGKWAANAKTEGVRA